MIYLVRKVKIHFAALLFSFSVFLASIQCAFSWTTNFVPRGHHVWESTILMVELLSRDPITFDEQNVDELLQNQLSSPEKLDSDEKYIALSNDFNTLNSSWTREDAIVHEISSGLRGVWMNRYYELCQFKFVHGHTIVPKRYEKNPSLGNWVNKQRYQYRNYQNGKRPCSLSKNRIDLLNEIGFCWDALQSNYRQQLTESNTDQKNYQTSSCNDVLTTKNDKIEWVKKFESLLEILKSCDVQSDNPNLRRIDRIPTCSSLGVWINNLRNNYKEKKDHPFSQDILLSQEHIATLNLLDPYWWMTRREYIWELRFQELCQYRNVYGDCCVPISYKANKQLGHWVSNQRKKLNTLSNDADCCDRVSAERIKRLNAIGFAWNRWDYEFNMKHIRFD